MPLRKEILVTNEVYHVVNRGVASSLIFKTDWDYQRLLELIDFYRFDNSKMSFSNFLKLEKTIRQEYRENLKKQNDLRIKIFSYCLMPNHLHFLVKQVKDRGIEKVLSNIQNAYAKYFNLKNKRQGPLFQSRFRAVRIEKEEIYTHISRYIHLNPSTAYLVKPDLLASYKWSSYPEFLGLREPLFTEPRDILAIVGGIKKYKDFVFNQANYQRVLANIKHLTLED